MGESPAEGALQLIVVEVDVTEPDVGVTVFFGDEFGMAVTVIDTVSLSVAPLLSVTVNTYE